MLDPNRLDRKLAPPPVVVEEVTVNGQREDPSQIAGFWAFDADHLREFAGPGPVARDDTAFYVGDGRETEDLVNILQVATAQPAN